MNLDFEKIVKLRLAVSRCGEMDRAKWWNTRGVLSHVGELAISRGFPKSHIFARCRTAFEVAASRSFEVFSPPESFTLWRLPVEIEDRIEESWGQWLGHPEPWKNFASAVDEASVDGILPCMTKLGLVSQQSLDRASKLRRADDLRSVPVKVDGESVEQLIEILAAAHSCSEQGKLAVPFIRESEFPK